MALLKMNSATADTRTLDGYKKKSMAIRKKALSLFQARGWMLVDTVDLGTTACVYVVEIDNTRYALKTCRHLSTARQLRVEYELIKHLRASPMADYVPHTHGWIPELHGFLMEYLRCPRLLNSSQVCGLRRSRVS